ncbi:hypothetical protein COEREDRAFT_46227 [Coemansia reversa NRRL 1564]|uniref:ATP-dependent DNA helicase n=1 Tax=Coemansia reversa (strain ATCC 12441 / NRRL 1564) TaxID=763665 RepID=A0A2G5B6W4_COERN|nr:hypothetical protein COEREDRAFT_46227 [Coemansia reversa NRRL 1564]|eukprot:PIA14755.1 hypothetical protein COEREDRAFT_46227 [Coemansia reversa NRRL 1564]
MLCQYNDNDCQHVLQKPSVLLCVPTGLAAFNICGWTIHSLFYIPINQGRDCMQLSSSLFNTMSQFFAQVKLNPVMGKAVYQTIMQQLDDVLFAQALNHMAIGEMDNCDKELIISRCYDVIPPGKYNGGSLVALFYSNADKRCKETGGLPKNVQLVVGTRYMITSNIDTKDGLVNGTIGILCKIQMGYNSNRTQEEPMQLWLETDYEHCGSNQQANDRVLRSHHGITENWIQIEWV